MGAFPATEQPPVDRVQDEVARRFLCEIWPGIEWRYAPAHVILFGSRASGKARPDSDIDLIMVSTRFEGERWAHRTRDFMLEIQPYRYGISVDVLCYTPAEFEEMSTGIGLVAEAVKEGIWLR